MQKGAARLTAVSYTHLDVYKRQALRRKRYSLRRGRSGWQESAAALQKLLRQSGIESVVQPQAGGVHVRLRCV